MLPEPWLCACGAIDGLAIIVVRSPGARLVIFAARKWEEGEGEFPAQVRFDRRGSKVVDTGGAGAWSADLVVTADISVERGNRAIRDRYSRAGFRNRCWR